MTTTPQIKRAAIYARVSTVDHQNYDRQVNELTTIAESMGYTEVDVYAESISGFKKSDTRPKLNELIQKTESDHSYYSTILTSEISRIGRDPIHTRKVIDRLSELNIPVYVQSLNLWTIQNGERNFITSIILQVLMEYAKVEADTFKTRSKSGLRKSAKDGKVGGGAFIAYGYKKRIEDKMMVIDENEAEVIKTIFNHYQSGLGVKRITNILNSEKIPTRSNLNNNKMKNDFSEVIWSDKVVLGILENTLYKGERRYKGEVFKVPAIITPELFDECTSIRTTKTHRNYLTTYTYLLKDIITCGCCGRNYFAKYKPVEGGDKVYICSSRLKKGGNCGNVGVNISLIESAVYNEIIGSDNVLKYLNSTTEIKAGIIAKIKSLNSNLSVKSIELKDKEKEQVRLIDFATKSDRNMKLFEGKQAKLEAEITQLNDSIILIKAELNNLDKAIINLDKNQTSRDSLLKAKENRTELEAIFKQLISKVVVNKLDADNVLITVYIAINGVVLGNTLKLILDVSGMRKKKFEYKYFSMFKMENEPRYNNGILITDTSEILSEVVGMSKVKDYVIIDDANILTI